MSKHHLFNEFNAVTAKAWKQKIQVDLKGADYNDTLIWKTLENINIKPFYSSEDLNLDTYNYNTQASSWSINSRIYVANDKKSNTKAKRILNRGAESITFIIPSDLSDVELLLSDIDLKSITIYFELKFLSSEFINKLDTIAKSSEAAFYVLTDTIGNLAESGNWFSTLKNDQSTLETIVKSSKHLKSCLSVDLTLYQNAGTHIVQELAYALAHANEYLNRFHKQFNTEIIFKVAVGSNYFFEIAKLRALRLLWATLASEYNLNTHCHIVAHPTKRNKTIYDYNTNLLRTSTECMSAILGGANTISNLAYDALFHKDNEFGERIARNQLLVFKHESYFNKVNNPADGAYYIESLTEQISENALVLFKDIEANGGFLKQLKEGIIQKKIKESAIKEQKHFNSGDLILLGTNKHPNPQDRMKNDLELYPFVKTNPRKTLIEPIIPKRLAEDTEQQRLKTE